MSTRTALASALKTQLAPQFDVKEIANLPDALRKPTVFVRQRSMAPAPNPGQLIATFIVSVACHIDITDNWSKAEDALDELLPQVLEALHNHLNMTWSSATLLVLKDKYLVYDIEASIPTNRTY